MMNKIFGFLLIIVMFFDVFHIGFAESIDVKQIKKSENHRNVSSSRSILENESIPREKDANSFVQMTNETGAIITETKNDVNENIQIQEISGSAEMTGGEGIHEEKVVINEIAWMGTVADSNDEWIELYNISGTGVDVSGWVLQAIDGSPKIHLQGIIGSGSYFLLERSDDNAISNVDSNQVYVGALKNSGEHLQLINDKGDIIDEIPDFFAGNSEEKRSMVRIDPYVSGTIEKNWQSFSGDESAFFDKNGKVIFGSPGKENKTVGLDHILPNDEKYETGSGEILDKVEIPACAGMTEGAVCEYETGSGEILDKVEIPACAGMTEGAVCEYETGSGEILDDVIETPVCVGTRIDGTCENSNVTSEKIFINELEYKEDWIEFLCENCSESGVNLHEYALFKNEQSSIYFRFPENTVIFPNEFVVVEFRKDEDKVFDRVSVESGSTLVKIHSKKPGIHVKGKLRIEKEKEIIDEVTWTSQAGNNFYNSYIQTGSGLDWTSVQTPGKSNIFLQPKDDVSSTENKKEKEKIFYDFSDEIYINEVFPNPKGPDSEKEYIEFINFENRPINLIGWKIDDKKNGGSRPKTLKEDFIIPPKSVKVLYYKDSKVGLNNDTDSVYLYDAAGKEIHAISYENAQEDRAYAMKHDKTFAWVYVPTPGTDNDFALPELNFVEERIEIAIVLPNPDGEDKGNETFTLVNPNPYPIDLKNWSFDNKPGGSSAYRIDDSIIIQPNEKRKFLQKETNIHFVNSFDQLRIFNPEGILVDILSWKNAKSGQIIRRESITDEDTITIVRVIDGDTFVAPYFGREETFRLIGVDTPETVHPEKEIEKFGQEASAFTKSVLEGKTVLLKYAQERRDKYNRILVYVYQENNTFFNAEVIRNGYGYAYTRFPFKYKDLFVTYQKEAQEFKRGLWYQEKFMEYVADELQEIEEELLINMLEEDLDNKTSTGGIVENTEITANIDEQKNYPKTIILSEIYPSPKKGEAEFIELFNTGKDPVDISHWILDDILDEGSKPYTLPEKTIIEPESFLTIKNISLSLNNTGDSVHLLSPNRKIQSFMEYKKHKKGQSFLYDFEKKVWKITDIPTPNAINTEILFLKDDLDTDGDGLSDKQEKYLYATNSQNPDTDSDGLTDKQEITWGTDPLFPTEINERIREKLQTELQKHTKLYKKFLFKTKGMRFRGRTEGDANIQIFLYGKNLYTFEGQADNDGKFEIFVSIPLEKGSYAVDLQVQNTRGITLYEEGIRNFILEENYTPYSAKKRVKGKTAKTPRIKYAYKNTFMGYQTIQGQIVENNPKQKTFILLLENNQKITVSYKSLQTTHEIRETLFDSGTNIKISGKNSSENIFEVYAYEIVVKRNYEQNAFSYIFECIFILFIFGGCLFYKFRGKMFTNKEKCV